MDDRQSPRRTRNINGRRTSLREVGPQLRELRNAGILPNGLGWRKGMATIPSVQKLFRTVIARGFGVVCFVPFPTGGTPVVPVAPPRWRLSMREGRNYCGRRREGRRGMRSQQVATLPAGGFRRGAIVPHRNRTRVSGGLLCAFSNGRERRFPEGRDKRGPSRGGGSPGRLAPPGEADVLCAVCHIFE